MRTICFLSILLAFSSCKKKNGVCLKSTGYIITQERNLGDFSVITIYNDIDLIITQDTINKATVKAGENIIDYIFTEDLQNDTLKIHNGNNCNWYRSYKKPIEINLHVRSLKELIVYGAGNITSTNAITGNKFGINGWETGAEMNLELNVDTAFASVHTGPGVITYTGSATISSAYTAGNGYIYLQNLNTSKTSVNNSGISDIHVNASQYLSAQIFSKGNIVYHQTPITLILDDTGEGELIMAN